MGRANNRSALAAAVGMAGFAEVMRGTRAGLGNGTIYELRPGPADRAELERLLRQFEGGATEEVLNLLREQSHNLTRLPLIHELHMLLCDKLASQARRRYSGPSAATMRSLGFQPDEQRGEVLDSEELQGKLQARLAEEAQRRTTNLLKLKTAPIDEDVVSSAAYQEAFCRFGAAQCYQQRERIVKDLLGSDEVPVNLRDVTSWRSVVSTLLEAHASGKNDIEVAKVLAGAKTALKHKEAAPRRRQRYIR